MMDYSLVWIVLSLLSFVCISNVLASGSMYDPPNRAVMWKYGFPTEKNYNYMQLNCGGEKALADGPRQCGLCGDPQNAEKEHEHGGKFGSGTIGRYYPAGIKEMSVKIELLAFEKGFFEFRLCSLNNYTLTQECLDENILPIKEGYLLGTPLRYYPKDARDFRLTIAIPPDLTCDHCVLQWRYHTANSWGTDPITLRQGLGYGPQEEFYNCADIRIGGEVPKSVKNNPFFAPPVAGVDKSNDADRQIVPTSTNKAIQATNATRGINNVTFASWGTEIFLGDQKKTNTFSPISSVLSKNELGGFLGNNTFGVKHIVISDIGSQMLETNKLENNIESISNETVHGSSTNTQSTKPSQDRQVLDTFSKNQLASIDDKLYNIWDIKRVAVDRDGVRSAPIRDQEWKLGSFGAKENNSKSIEAITNFTKEIKFTEDLETTTLSGKRSENERKVETGTVQITSKGEIRFDLKSDGVLSSKVVASQDTIKAKASSDKSPIFHESSHFNVSDTISNQANIKPDALETHSQTMSSTTNRKLSHPETSINIAKELLSSTESTYNFQASENGTDSKRKAKTENVHITSKGKIGLESHLDGISSPKMMSVQGAVKEEIIVPIDGSTVFYESPNPKIVDTNSTPANIKISSLKTHAQSSSTDIKLSPPITSMDKVTLEHKPMSLNVISGKDAPIKMPHVGAKLNSSKEIDSFVQNLVNEAIKGKTMQETPENSNNETLNALPLFLVGSEQKSILHGHINKTNNNELPLFNAKSFPINSTGFNSVQLTSVQNVQVDDLEKEKGEMKLNESDKQPHLDRPFTNTMFSNADNSPKYIDSNNSVSMLNTHLANATLPKSVLANGSIKSDLPGTGMNTISMISWPLNNTDITQNMAGHTKLQFPVNSKLDKELHLVSTKTGESISASDHVIQDKANFIVPIGILPENAPIGKNNVSANKILLKESNAQLVMNNSHENMNIKNNIITPKRLRDSLDILGVPGMKTMAYELANQQNNEAIVSSIQKSMNIKSNTETATHNYENNSVIERTQYQTPIHPPDMIVDLRDVSARRNSNISNLISSHRNQTLYTEQNKSMAVTSALSGRTIDKTNIKNQINSFSFSDIPTDPTMHSAIQINGDGGMMVGFGPQRGISNRIRERSRIVDRSDTLAGTRARNNTSNSGVRFHASFINPDEITTETRTGFGNRRPIPLTDGVFSGDRRTASTSINADTGTMSQPDNYIESGASDILTNRFNRSRIVYPMSSRSESSRNIIGRSIGDRDAGDNRREIVPIGSRMNSMRSSDSRSSLGRDTRRGLVLAPSDIIGKSSSALRADPRSVFAERGSSLLTERRPLRDFSMTMRGLGSAGITPFPSLGDFGSVGMRSPISPGSPTSGFPFFSDSGIGTGFPFRPSAFPSTMEGTVGGFGGGMDSMGPFGPAF